MGVGQPGVQRDQAHLGAVAHQGQHERAMQLLAPRYSWFTEGFETADVTEARLLLEELSAQLESGARAALVVYWRELDRQVRVRGTVERLGAAESDAYFATRSRDSQLGAWASPQSQALESREGLDDLVREAEARFGKGEVPRPAHWGGYLVRPRTIEFWQGQVGRLHDRFRYARDGDGWTIERLAP